MNTGYAATPLADTLDLKPGMRLFVADMPDAIRTDLALDRLGVELLAAPGMGIDAAHIFVTDREQLDRTLGALRQLIAPTGFIWVSWPTPSSARGEVDEDVIRDTASPLGLIDVKACTVDESWSALKLMTRKELRRDA